MQAAAVIVAFEIFEASRRNSNEGCFATDLILACEAATRERD